MERTHPEEHGFFISYRRADSGGWAGRLRDHLENRFGPELVWQDVEDLKPGAEWPKEILRAIRMAEAVLIVIGPHWLRLGRQRLRDPHDVLRAEIERALRRRSALVMPVLVGGAGLPPANELPRSLRPLRDRQIATLLDSDWSHSVEVLIERLREVVAARRDRGSRPRIPLVDVHAQLDSLQYEFFERLEGRDPTAALKTARRALALLDQQLPQYPQDARLNLQRGYFLKNEAMALRDSGDPSGSSTALDNAESAFRGMLREVEMNTAAVYNGMGSMLALRGQYCEALEWIDRALGLYPNYEAARQDRELVAGLVASSPRRPERRRGRTALNPTTAARALKAS